MNFILASIRLSTKNYAGTPRYSWRPEVFSLSYLGKTGNQSCKTRKSRLNLNKRLRYSALLLQFFLETNFVVAAVIFVDWILVGIQSPRPLVPNRKRNNFWAPPVVMYKVPGKDFLAAHEEREQAGHLEGDQLLQK